jgi:hypothetical protein
MNKKICSICKKKYEGFGNNAEPINNGRCCDECNKIVLLERIKILMSRQGTKK